MRWSFITDGNYINFRHTDETDLHIQQTIHRLHNTSRCIDWSLPADTTRITFTIDESKYENISIYDVDFDGVVMDSQDDFETGITAMFTGLASGGSSSYLVYNFSLQQAGLGSENPSVSIRQNTFGGATIWTRDSQGVYSTITTTDEASDYTKYYVVGQKNAADVSSIPIYTTANNLQGFVQIEFSVSGGKIQIIVYAFDAAGSAGDIANVFGNGVLDLPEIRYYNQ